MITEAADAGFPILKRLSDEQVFSVSHNTDRRIKNGKPFSIGEECDQWYSEELSKEEMLALAEEIRQFAESAEP